MIQVQIRDTLVDIVEKIESQETGDIVLDFPLGHPILHNYVALKVLKSKVKNKRFIIATSDKIGRKIGKSLGIEYSIVKNKSFLEQNSQAELMQHNYSFWEYIKYQISSYKSELKSGLEANKGFHSISKYSHIYTEKNSLSIFFIILLGSIILFIFVYYFVVSQTLVYITPERVIRTEAHNFIFKENIENNILGNNKYIQIRTLTKIVQSSEIYPSTGTFSKNDTQSEGIVRLYNKYPEVQDLIPGTRLQDENGVVFEISEGVQIPGSIVDNFGNISPGQVEISANSKEKDSSGKFIGVRGNIEAGTPLILPALDLESQKMIYAESIVAFEGGEDTFEKVVTDTDVEDAILLFQETLKSSALGSIKQDIDELNTVNSASFDILSGGKSIIYSEPEITVEPGVSAGDQRENFSISGNIRITAYIYNTTSVVQKLRTLIGERTLEGIEKIAFTNPSSLRMSQVLYINEADSKGTQDPSDDDVFELKATFEIDSIFVHDFLNTENSYIDLLASKIRGLPKKEAEKILLNDPQVSNVEIRIRPFFIQTVSNIGNNIIFKVREN
ncbi:hypothetical protein N9J72_00755 [Candidatus Gracilibacteria bacterium]|nr:hypothetical protein [Candidatus Gracilibacteria bacterium]